MSRTTARIRLLAEHLIALETRRNKSTEPKPPAAFLVCEKLRPDLATLMGSAGFRALLSRALALTYAEVPWLSAVQVKADGSLDGLGALEAQVDPTEFTEDSVVLVAQLLGLLAAFIGEDLTVRLVREVWPKVTL